jgi:hypothetical protein
LFLVEIIGNSNFGYWLHKGIIFESLILKSYVFKNVSQVLHKM